MNYKHILIHAKIVAIITTIVTSTTAHAEPTAEQLARAQKLDSQATAKFKSRKYKEALDLFKQTFALAPNPTTTWNISRCHEELKEIAQAYRVLEKQYLLGFKDLPASKKEKARAQLAILKDRLDRWSLAQRRGIGLLSQEREDEALIAFQEAWDIAHEPETLWKIIIITSHSENESNNLRKLIEEYKKLDSISERDRQRADSLLNSVLNGTTFDELEYEESIYLKPNIGAEDNTLASATLSMEDVGWLTLWSGVGLLTIGGLVRLSYEPAVQEYNNSPSSSRKTTLENYIEPRSNVAIFFALAGLTGAGVGGVLIWNATKDGDPIISSIRLHTRPGSILLESNF